MRSFARSFLGALAIAIVLTGSILVAQTKSRPFKKPKQTLHLNVSKPTTVRGEGTTTTSGLTYWDIETGAGEAAVKGKIVKIHYRGWGQDGKEFVNSVAVGEPSIFRLGARQVIQGWDGGVEGMRVGGKRQLRIPPSLAYGDVGSAPFIMPNSTLIFDIELIGVQ